MGSPALTWTSDPFNSAFFPQEVVRQGGAGSYILSFFHTYFLPSHSDKTDQEISPFFPPDSAGVPWCQSRSFLPLHRQVSTPVLSGCPSSSAFSRGLSHYFRLQNVNDGNGSFLPDEGSESVNGERGPERPSQGAWCCQCAGTLGIFKSLTLTVKVNCKTRGGRKSP